MKEKQPVKIRVSGTNNDKDDATLYAEGNMEQNNLCKIIEYTTKDENYKENKTIITISEDIVTITKNDDISYTMIFEQGQNSQAMINTPYGDTNANVYCKSCVIKDENKSITVDLEYNLSIGDDVDIKNNKINIYVFNM